MHRRRAWRWSYALVGSVALGGCSGAGTHDSGESMRHIVSATELVPGADPARCFELAGVAADEAVGESSAPMARFQVPVDNRANAEAAATCFRSSYRDVSIAEVEG